MGNGASVGPEDVLEAPVHTPIVVKPNSQSQTDPVQQDQVKFEGDSKAKESSEVQITREKESWKTAERASPAIKQEGDPEDGWQALQPSVQDIHSLTLRELKAEVIARGGSIVGCVERKDLEAKLLQTIEEKRSNETGNLRKDEQSDIQADSALKMERTALSSGWKTAERVSSPAPSPSRSPDAPNTDTGAPYASTQIPSSVSNNTEPTGSTTPQQYQPQIEKEAQPKKNRFVVEEVKEEEDDASLTDILLQSIPFYGQGNPANDSTVRAALSGLSIEDIDSKDEYGNTLLLLACTHRCEDLVRIMLNKGADPNAVNSSGACSLHFACYGETSSYLIAKLLLQNGANPEVAETTYGCTPLHYCASSGNIEFCKLLLSYGAQISRLDFYNYTCVDYAREAGLKDVEAFLQKRLDKYNSQFQTRLNHGFGSSQNMAGFDDVRAAEGWTRHVDPQSGGYYFSNAETGECLWEHEYKIRVPQIFMESPQSKDAVQYFGADKTITKVSSTPTSRQPAHMADASGAQSSQSKSKAGGEDLRVKAARNRLVALFTKFEPKRLMDVEFLLVQNRGKEDELLKDLTALYAEPKLESVEPTPLISINSFQKPPNIAIPITEVDADEMVLPPPSPTMQPKMSARRPGTASRHRPSSASTGVGTMTLTAPPGMDPAVVQAMVAEERTKFEAKLEEEREAFRTGISAKDGDLSKLESDLEALYREKQCLQDDLAVMGSKLDRLQMQGGEALAQSESEVSRLQSEVASLKDEVSRLHHELRLRDDKISGLNDTLEGLKLGNEERIASEKAAAEERERQQREREGVHRKELQEVEEQRKAAEAKAKSDMAKARAEWNNKEEELKDAHDQMRRAKDIEIESLKRELAEKKAKYTQDISEMTMKFEHAKQVADAATIRADQAEATLVSMQAAIEEAQVVQQFNAQLHKDLGREQLARKRLHNEMEDLKGRIRVYVRVRPLSRTETERGCSEAVLKDGKLSVVVKGTGPDGKKIFDFDQVFGGAEGNTQTDVFRDTKHLMMSVLDGYNVCIFAYGQTGAGKSYTMIGSADIGTCLRENGEFDESAGITPRAVSEIFRLLNERHAQITYEVEVQMFQLYRDGLDDLLFEKKKKKKGGDDEPKGPLKITLAEHSPTGLVQVEGAVSMTALTPNDVMTIFAAGSARRATASTQMNAESSRSHLICSLVVKMTNRRNENTTVGKLTLVDLAGSERVDKSGAEGDVMKEAQSINKSLSALGDVIAALTSGRNQHVPYRNHPLTMLMSDSIGGNAKTLMFVNTSPADYNVPETVSSLGFASRCKDITNSVASGPGVQAAQVNALKKELAKLKKGGGGGATKPGASLQRPV